MIHEKNEQKNEKKRTLVFKTKKGIKRNLQKKETNEQDSLDCIEDQTNIPSEMEQNNVEGGIDE